MPILATPPGVIGEAVDSWQAFHPYWHGCDGSLWDLLDIDGGVVLTPDGTKGLGMPTFDRYTTISPALAGSKYRGSRTQERDWLWPLFVSSGVSTVDYLNVEQALWKSMRPDRVGTFELVHPDGSSRSLDLRFVDDNGQAFGMDPAQQGWSVYAVNMVADDQPYWYSAPVARNFPPPSESDFFLTTGGVFFITPGGSTSTAKIPNPGDVPAWPVWTVIGSCSAATLGAGGGSVVTPAIGDGDVWTIDTNPAKMSVRDQDGVDHSAEVDWNPAPIPPGTQVELTLSIDTPGDTAQIACTIVPRYFRAF